MNNNNGYSGAYPGSYPQPTGNPPFQQPQQQQWDQTGYPVQQQQLPQQQQVQVYQQPQPLQQPQQYQNNVAMPYQQQQQQTYQQQSLQQYSNVQGVQQQQFGSAAASSMVAYNNQGAPQQQQVQQQAFYGSTSSSVGYQQQGQQQFQQQQQQQYQSVVSASNPYGGQPQGQNVVTAQQVFTSSATRVRQVSDPVPYQPQTQFQQIPQYQQAPAELPQQQQQITVLPSTSRPYSMPSMQSFSNLSQYDAPFKQPLSRSSSTTSFIPKTNLLSHGDGSLLLQEVFVISGELDEYTGYGHILDLQGIWARVRNQNSTSEMRLALRMINTSSSVNVSAVDVTINPNSFGLNIEGKPNILQSVGGTLRPNQSATCNLTLACNSSNQRITEDGDLSVATIVIQYGMSSGQSPATQLLNCYHKTCIPLQIFFVDHPQADPTSYVSDPDLLKCADDGPRLTQGYFLNMWPSTQLPAHSFVFEGIQWKRWYLAYSQAGVLQAITGTTFATATPTTREVMKVFERKMSTNRIYVVASREVPSPGSALPSLVFFCSLKIGLLDGGQLILAELRMVDDDWSKCEVKLKSAINQRIWPSLERAVKAILLS